MKWLLMTFMFAATLVYGQGQTRPTLAQPVYRFKSEGKSRLVALARLGAAVQISILVESGSLKFLEEPITVRADAEPLESVINRIVSGPEHFKVKPRGSLLVIYPTLLHVPTNRLLSLKFAPITYQGTTIFDLNQTLLYAIERASGCKNVGFVWTGMAFKLSVPPFHLASSNLEDIAEKVAESSERWMWVVAPTRRHRGCINELFGTSQFSVYDTEEGRYLPFSSSIGPDFVR